MLHLLGHCALARLARIAEPGCSPSWVAAWLSALASCSGGAELLGSSLLGPEILAEVWRYNAAARRVQRAWRRAIADPERTLCRRRLVRELSELCRLSV
jgi:hypothetical protein